MLSTQATSFQIEATPNSGFGTLNCSVTSELMQNHSAGLPVDPQHQIQVVQDNNGSPMVFSIGTNGKFYLVMRQDGGQTGWQQIDLSAGLLQADATLGADATAQAFAVSQNQNGTFRVAVAVTPANTGNQNTHLYITRELSNDPSQTDFHNLGSQWVHRPDNIGGASVEKIILGSTDDGKGAPMVLVIAKHDGEDKRYFINANFTDTSWIWKPYPIPQNADHVLDVTVGTYGGLRGTWALYMVGPNKVLMFTSMKTPQVPQPINVQYKPVPPGAATLATLPGKGGGSDLYVGGDGLYVYKTETRPPQAITIADAKAAPGVTEMILAQDHENVSIWAMSSQEQLLHVQGQKSSPQTWGTPVPLFDNVSQIAAMRSLTRQGNEIFLITNDSKLEHLWQDPATSLWNRSEISVHSTGDMVSYNCYMTTLKVVDGKGVAAINLKLNITSSSWTYVNINGRSHVLAPDHPITVTPNELGQIVIQNKVNDVSSPFFHVTGDVLTTAFDLHPAAGLNQKLSSLTAEQLSAATYQHGANRGEKVLQGDYAHPERVNASVKVLEKITDLSTVTTANSETADSSLSQPGVQVREATAAPSNAIDTGKLPPNYAWGFTADGSAVNYYESNSALGVIEDILVKSNPIAWFIGDIIKHFEEHIESKPKSFFMHLNAEGVLQLLIDFGESVFQATLDVLEQVGKTLHWVLQELLGIDIDQILAWLGFVFDWDDILTTHQFMVDMSNRLLDMGSAEMQVFEGHINSMFDLLDDQLTKMQPLGGHLGTKSFTQHRDEANQAAQSGSFADVFSQISDFFNNSPVGNWGNFQLLHGDLFGIPDFTQEKPWMLQLTEAFAHLATDTFIEEMNNAEDTITNVINDLKRLNDEDKLSIDNVIAQIGGDLLKGLLNAVRTFVINLLKCLEEVCKAVKAGMNEKIDIPLLSPLYKQITNGSDLTLLDGMMLLTAIPATVGYKIVANKAPFQKGERMDISFPFTDANGNAMREAINRASLDSVEFADELGYEPTVTKPKVEKFTDKDRTLSYFNAICYSFGTLAGLIVDIIAYKKEGVRVFGGLKNTKMVFGIIKVIVTLPLTWSSFPYTADKVSYPVQMVVGVLTLVGTLFKDTLFTVLSAKDYWNIASAKVAFNVVYEVIKLYLELPILAMELERARKGHNKQAETDVILKFVQHGLDLLSEGVAAIEELGYVKGGLPELFVVGGALALKTGSSGINIYRMADNLNHMMPHHNV